MRQQLTYHKLPVTSIVISAIVMLVGYVYGITGVDHNGVTGAEIFSLCSFFLGGAVFVISLLSLLTVWLQKRRIEFDELSMYLKRKGEESTIPLKNIKEIGMTGWWLKTPGRSWYDYRIEFLDDHGETVYIKFLHIAGKGNIDLFQSNVRRQNPSVEIKNWATSLDPLINIFRKRK